ncbi:hypothetical protein IscW_ISCW010064 [Ixodes scapularis]|uniref:Uncharacterized protein n=1 Tax=Ixodes scapularis TaxID=6945 RepID=B7Q2T3_IXOSC|nr:hypothetical protein IscW_ISCW010064 [Ixodes scapularis]|eukprot:XP_002411009.1 hypothetical protein IscW_ISCW010064 [Ixodes scapularis]
MQDSLVVALQQLFPRTATTAPSHPDTTQGPAAATQGPSQPSQPHATTSTYPGPTQTSSGYTFQAALGGYEAKPAAQAAASGQPQTQPPFQTAFNPPQPFTPSNTSRPPHLCPAGTQATDLHRSRSPNPEGNW